jgi:hypothetical protein
MSQSILGIHADFLSAFQCASLLMKKALESLSSVGSNSENAVTPGLFDSSGGRKDAVFLRVAGKGSSAVTPVQSCRSRENKRAESLCAPEFSDLHGSDRSRAAAASSAVHRRCRACAMPMSREFLSAPLAEIAKPNGTARLLMKNREQGKREQGNRDQPSFHSSRAGNSGAGRFTRRKA